MVNDRKNSFPQTYSRNNALSSPSAALLGNILKTLEKYLIFVILLYKERKYKHEPHCNRIPMSQ